MDYLNFFISVSSFLFLFSVAMRETKEGLENVSSSLEVLQEGMGKLKASLSEERASLSNTLSDPACTNGAVSHTCNAIRSTLSQLGANADFSRVPRSQIVWLDCLSWEMEIRKEKEKKLYNLTIFTYLPLISCVCQLPDVNHALANINTILGTDLSNIVQKVSSSFSLYISPIIFLRNTPWFITLLS